MRPPFRSAFGSRLLSGKPGAVHSLHISHGRLAESNAQQVAKIRRIVEDLGSESATPDEAREILGLRGGDRVGFRPDRPDRYGRTCRDQRTRFSVRTGYGREAAAKNSFSLLHFPVRKSEGFSAHGGSCQDIESHNAHSCICRTMRAVLRWPKRAGRQSANTATKRLPTELLPTNPLVVV